MEAVTAAFVAAAAGGQDSGQTATVEAVAVALGTAANRALGVPGSTTETTVLFLREERPRHAQILRLRDHLSVWPLRRFRDHFLSRLQRLRS